MNTVIIVSKCLRVTNFTFNKKKYEFHFRGVFVGNKIRRIELTGASDLNIKKGEEYILYVKIVTLENGIIKGFILKSRDLEQCKDQS
jgi:hypothetical protein